MMPLKETIEKRLKTLMAIALDRESKFEVSCKTYTGDMTNRKFAENAQREINLTQTGSACHSWSMYLTQMLKELEDREISVSDEELQAANVEERPEIVTQGIAGVLPVRNLH